MSISPALNASKRTVESPKYSMEILSKFKGLELIKIITELRIIKKLKIEFTKKEIQDYNPDYIVICSETNLHFKHLNKVTGLSTRVPGDLRFS